MSTSLHNGKLSLVQHNLPPLLSGVYTVKIQQKVEIRGIDYHGKSIDAGSSQTYDGKDLSFYSGVDRFHLRETDLHSVFPPAMSAGKYTSVLPHVVLAHARLPWMWTLSGGPQRPDPASGDVAPWLALLVFDAEDPTPPPVMRTLGELQGQESGVVTYPNLALEPGETADTPVLTIDVPALLWRQIAPTAADLEHLAHVRVTSPASKASTPGKPRSDYSVVIANRLPAGERTTVHLVCLEGMADYLPGSGHELPADVKVIRLASLTSFQFSALPDDVSFANTLRQVIKDGLPTTLALPASTTTIPTVARALEMGYTACLHQTRLGASTYSWYRGPLVPVAASLAGRMTSPARNADALLRYDPDTGLFDTTYAAAWQLGRLLALQNKEYAVALYRWKHARPPSGAKVPDIVRDWLGRLALLYGVPFNYLVPDERMSPDESLRFFQVDPLWMDCLMDGAFSMGRSTSAVLEQDGDWFKQIQDEAIAAAREVRPGWLGSAGDGEPKPIRGDGTITGFLLRSAVVSAYPGMEIRAYAGADKDDEAAPLALLRHESLAPNLRLCLFDGTIGHVTLRQPPEGLHFGMDVDLQDKYVTDLRSPETGEETGGRSDPVPFRTGDRQVVDISGHASNLARALGKPVTSDVFALQMIEGAHEVFFIRQ